MAINAGDARPIADETNGTAVTGTGQTVDNIDEGTGSVFDVYSQVIPNVITNGQSHQVRYVCVYLRNTTAGGTPITVTNISIGNTGNHNFRLDNDPSFPLLNVNGTTLVPGDTTASVANTSFIKLNEGGTNFVVDDGDAAVERTEYIDGVDRILATTIPAEKYRCFIVAEVPNKETVNGVTETDGLVLVVNGISITFDLTSSSVTGMNIGQFVVHDLNDLNAHEDFLVSEDADITGNSLFFPYDTHLTTNVTAPLALNWDGTSSVIKDDSNITVLQPDREYFGCGHNSVIIGFKSIAQNLAAEAGLQILADSGLLDGSIGFAQGDDYTVSTTSTGFKVKNNLFFISDVTSNAPALEQFPANHDNGAEGAVFANVASDKYFLVEGKDTNNLIAPSNTSDVNKAKGLLYLVYKPNANATPNTVINNANIPLTQIGTGIKVNYNKVYFAHISGNEFGASKAITLTGTVTGVRGTIANATEAGNSHNAGDDGGITKQTNTNLISTTVNNVQFNFSKLFARAGEQLNLDTLLSSSVTAVQSLTGDIASVTLSSSVSQVSDGGVANITITAPSSLSSLPYNASTLSFNQAITSGTIDIYPPSVGRQVDYNADGTFNTQNFSLNYNNVYTKEPTEVSRALFQSFGWFLEAGDATSPTPFTLDASDMQINPMEAECMLVSFDPTQTKFTGHADTSNTSNVVGDSGYQAGTGKNEGIVITPGTGVPRDSWLSSLNGRSIELHSVRNQYDGTTDASITNANSYGTLNHPDTFNEFGAVIDTNGIDSTVSGGTKYNISNGVIAYKTQSGAQLNENDNYYHHLGEVVQADASTNDNTPFFPVTFSPYAKDSTSKIVTGFQNLDQALGSAQQSLYYQNMRTLWIYNPGGERIRITGVTLDDFEYKNGGAGVDVWEKISDQTSGTSFNPNVIFLSQTESGASSGSAAVSSPIKIVVPKIGSGSPSQSETEDTVAFVDNAYRTYTAVTNKHASVLAPTHEFRNIASVSENYESGAAANSAMRPNSAGTATAKCIPIHCFFDHIFIDNTDIKEGNSVLSLSGLPGNGQVNAKLSVKYVSDKDIRAASSKTHKGATTVLGDLTGSDNSSLDSFIVPQEISIRLSMNFVATQGTLSITDEDNDIITSGGQINFSA